MQLEDYRLQQLKFIGKAPQQQFLISENNKKNAIQFLKHKHLLGQLSLKPNTTRFLGENENKVIIFLT